MLVGFVFGVESLQQGSQDAPWDLLMCVYQRLDCLLHLQSKNANIDCLKINIYIHHSEPPNIKAIWAWTVTQQQCWSFMSDIMSHKKRRVCVVRGWSGPVLFFISFLSFFGTTLERPQLSRSCGCGVSTSIQSRFRCWISQGEKRTRQLHSEMEEDEKDGAGEEEERLDLKVRTAHWG